MVDRRPVERRENCRPKRHSRFSPPRAKGNQGLVASTCLLSPFPLASQLVVVGNTALDHFAAPLIARHDEGSEAAAAEAKPAESHHDNELQQLAHRSSSGNLAIFAAIRRASSRGLFPVLRAIRLS